MGGRHWFFTLGLAVVLAGMAPFMLSGAAAQGPPAWVAGELLVTVRPGVSRGKAEALYKAHGAALIDEIPQIRTHLLRVPPQALEHVEQALARRPEVEAVEKNRLHSQDLLVNDPKYPNQWQLPKIMAPQAWDHLEGEPRVTIAIVDSGVDGAHPDLKDNLVPGYNFYNNTPDTADVTGHGTKVAGAAAAVTDNEIGVASPAYQAFIMPVRVGSPEGTATTTAIAKGVTWAADRGARVINLSWSGVAGSSTITSAAQYARSTGAVVVAAAGNCGCDDPTPENPAIISVSATDAGDRLASFSSRGPYVDLAAPGVSIYTTVKGGGYGAVSGTSFSSPITAGVAAAMLSVNPELSPQEVEAILKATADDLGPAGSDPSFGHGRVNAGAAVAQARGTSPTPDRTPPTAGITAPAEGAVVSGTVIVSVAAADDVGVTQVELYVDGSLFATDTAPPFSFAWDTAKCGDGLHTLTAVAHDAAGHTGVSAPVQVTVANLAPDSIPPEAVILSPADGATVSKVVKVKVRARDNLQVQRVELYLDGLLTSAASVSGEAVEVQFSLNAHRLAKGAHTLHAVAFDAAGHAGVSPSVTVTVK